MDEELKRLFDQVRAMREETSEARAEARRHFDVATERMEHRFQTLAESVGSLDEKLDRKIDGLDERMRGGFDETGGDDQVLTRRARTSHPDARARIHRSSSTR